MALTETLLANKVLVAVAGMVVIGGAGATYVAMDGIGPSTDSNQMADTVPEGVDTVAYMDPTVAEDGTTEDLVNGLINISKDRQGELYTGPDDYEAVMEEAQSNSSLSLDDLDRVMMYAKYPDANATTAAGLPDDGYVGFIIDSQWSEAEFVEETSNDTEYEKGDYEGYTVYEGENVSKSESEGWIGVLEDGQYVVGTETAVTDAIDVHRGAMDAFSGDLRTAYDDTRSGDSTYLKFAARFPDEEELERASGGMGTDSEESDSIGADDEGSDGLGSGERFTAVKNISVMSGSYYTESDTIGMQMRLETGAGNEADDLGSILDGGIVLVKQSARTEETQDLLDEVDVEEDGTAVTITFESEVDVIVDAIEAANDEWSGAGGPGYGEDSEFRGVEPSVTVTAAA